MRKHFYLFFLVNFFLFSPAFLKASPSLKIGVVDVSRLVQDSPQAKEANKILSDEFKPQEDQIRKLTNEIIQLTEDYKRNRSIMTETRIAEIENDIFVKERNLKRLRTDFQEALSRKRNLKLSETLVFIRQAIVRFSKEKDYDLVLYLEGNAAYVKSSVDITVKILEALKTSHVKSKNP